MRAGVVVKLPSGREAALLSEAGAALAGRAGGRAFVDASEVRAIVIPQVVRLLGEAGGARVGVAVVDGRVHAAFDFGVEAPGTPPTAALAMSQEGRAEAWVALGLGVVGSGRYADATESDAIVDDGALVPILDLGTALRAVDQAAWASIGALGIGAPAAGAPA